MLEGVAVWIVGREAEASRSWKRWRVGDPEGSAVGVVAWLGARQHAVRLVGRDVDRFVAQLSDGSPTQAPWWTTVVGAPKGKKKGYGAKRLGGLIPFAKSSGDATSRAPHAAFLVHHAFMSVLWSAASPSPPLAYADIRARIVVPSVSVVSITYSPTSLFISTTCF